MIVGYAKICYIIIEFFAEVTSHPMEGVLWVFRAVASVISKIPPRLLYESPCILKVLGAAIMNSSRLRGKLMQTNK